MVCKRIHQLKHNKNNYDEEISLNDSKKNTNSSFQTIIEAKIMKYRICLTGNNKSDWENK